MATEHYGGHEDCSSRTVCGQMYQPASSLVELASEYAFVAVAEVVAREAGWAVDGGVSTVVHFSLERVVRGTETAELAAFALVVAGGSISVSSTEICSPGDSWKSLTAGTRVLAFGDWSERVDGLLEMAEWLPLDGSQIVTTNSHLLNSDFSMTVDQLASELASQAGGNEP